MAAPVIDSHGAVMFVAGDDRDGKAVVTQLATDVGFEAIDAGPLRVARSLEELPLQWMHLAYNAPGLDRNFAFTIFASVIVTFVASCPAWAGASPSASSFGVA